MRKNILFLCLTLLLFACEKEDQNLTFTDHLENLQMPEVEMYAHELMKEAGWEGERSNFVASDSRKVLSQSWLHSHQRSIIDQENDIAHHIFEIRVGKGKYDRIRLHRVVRMKSRNFPIRTDNTAFLLHGDFKDFEGMFLPGVKSPRIEDNIGFAVYLAKNNVDVWGIDQSWTLVPAEESNFSFMQDWDMLRQVQDLKKAMTLVRVIRFLSGHGLNPINLLGYSSGSVTGFALLDAELDQPEKQRNVAGYISVDFGIVADNAEWEAATCESGMVYQGLFDSGQYNDINPLPLFGTAALADPEGPSELIPGFSNLQAALAVGVYPPFGSTPGYYLAGTFDDNFVPTGLKLSDIDDWIDFMTYAPPYEPIAFEKDAYNTPCLGIDVSWDDRLSQIRNPILYVSAVNGFGPNGEGTLDLLGSDDISLLTVSLHSDNATADFGHVDLFLADDAENLMWEPIVNWLKTH